MSKKSLTLLYMLLQVVVIVFCFAGLTQTFATDAGVAFGSILFASIIFIYVRLFIATYKTFDLVLKKE